jgi:hypothetical protein
MGFAMAGRVGPLVPGALSPGGGRADAASGYPTDVKPMAVPGGPLWPGPYTVNDQPSHSYMPAGGPEMMQVMFPTSMSMAAAATAAAGSGHSAQAPAGYQVVQAGGPAGGYFVMQPGSTGGMLSPLTASDGRSVRPLARVVHFCAA